MELIRKDIDFEVRAAGDPEERLLEFVGSTSDADRYGDVIELEGWDLQNYQKNPVFLWAHDYKQPPIGKAVKVGKTDNGLLFRIQFPTAEEYPFADTVYKLYLGGYLRATSVGFQDLEREPITDKEGRQTGFRYKKQELYELSAVPIPANPNALIMAVQKGVVSAQEVEQISSKSSKQPDLNREEEALKEPRAADDLERDEQKIVFQTLSTLVEELKAKIDQLITRITELRPPNLDPSQLKAVVREALEEFVKSNPKGTDIYSLVLNPGAKPDGGRPAGEPDINQLLVSTQKLHRLVKGGNEHVT